MTRALNAAPLDDRDDEDVSRSATSSIPYHVGPAALLLVDDIPDNLFALRAMLHRDDVNIVTARSAREALEALLVHPIALAIIDVHMPEVDGFELAALMRGVERTRHVPIIFVTAASHDQRRLFQGYEAGAVDFLFKPIEARVLRGKVEVFITLDRQRRQLALSEQRFRGLVQSTSQAVWHFGPDGKVLGDSPTWRALTGQSLEDWTQNRWAEAIHPEDVERVRDLWQRALLDRAPFEVEYRLLRADGRYTWTHARAAPIFDRQLGLVEWVGANTDIESRKQTQQRETELLARTRMSEIKFRTLFDSGMIGVVFADDAGRVVDANRAFLSLLGYRQADLDARRLSLPEVTPAEFREVDELAAAQIRNTGIYLPYQKEFLHRRGEGVPVLVGGALVRGSGVVVSFVLDMTKTRQADRLREMFVAILGHDLRNPLAVMLSATQLALGRSADPSLQTLLRKVLSSGARMTRMIEQMLDLTRIRLGGGMVLTLQDVDLLAIVEQAIAGATSAKERFVIEVLGDTHGSWDSDRLFQVASNLAGNACEHSPDGSPIDVLIDGRDPAYVVLRLRNDGPPIPEHLRGTLFEPFRGSMERQRATRGLGLGLYISQQIVLAHGGSIEVDSSEATGTSFTVKIPRARHPSTPPPPGSGEYRFQFA